MLVGFVFDRRKSASRRNVDARQKRVVSDQSESDENLSNRPSHLSNRRQTTDRRGWRFGLIYRTTESHSTIEAWMEDNCVGEWGLGIEDIDTELTKKSFKLMFDQERDKKAFLNSFVNKK